MKDVRKILSRICETGKFPKGLITPAQIHEAWDIRHYLDYNDSVTTISTEVSNFYRSAGYKVITDGIGWRIKDE